MILNRDKLNREALALAVSFRRMWGHPGRPAMSLRAAMDKARGQAVTLATRGGVGAYRGTPCGMFRAEPLNREARWQTDVRPDFTLRQEDEARAHWREHSRNGYWLTDESKDDARRPRVARVGKARKLPCGGYSARWIPGFATDMSGGTVWDTSQVFWGTSEAAPRDAEVAAHEMAIRDAEEAAEYDSAWQAGSMAADKLSEARAGLRGGLRAAARLRAAEVEAREAGAMRAAAELRAQRAANVAEAREVWAEALDAFETERPGKHDNRRLAAAWREGAGI